jgi:hypothetical protein
MRLPLDILDTIAGLSLQHYRLMLALPRFARSTIPPTPQSSSHYIPPHAIATHVSNHSKQLHFQHHFTKYTITEKDYCLDSPLGTLIYVSKGSIVYTLNGKNHRVQFGPNAGPSITTTDDNGEVLLEMWIINGILHRIDGPAYINNSITRYKNNPRGYNYNVVMWYLFGQKHRDGGPAQITTHEDGLIYYEWYQYGYSHREDGPALIRTGQSHSRHHPRIESSLTLEAWYLHGQFHRKDGPAHTLVNGAQEWWFHGAKHREDGPAVIHPNGKHEWWQHDKRHRPIEGALAGPAITHPNGSYQWFQYGVCHRPQTGPLEGPAKVDRFGTEEWYLFGQKHRVDGPAVIYIKGNEEWYRNGKLHREIVGENSGPAQYNRYHSDDDRYWLDGAPLRGVPTYSSKHEE